jgi:hypothetical protein
VLPPCPARGISVASAIRYVVEELSGDERPRALVYTPTGSLFINKIEALYETRVPQSRLAEKAVTTLKGQNHRNGPVARGRDQAPASAAGRSEEGVVAAQLEHKAIPVASPATSARLELTLNVPGPLTAARATAASSELSDESGGRIAGSRLRERANHIRTRTVMRDGSL